MIEFCKFIEGNILRIVIHRGCNQVVKSLWLRSSVEDTEKEPKREYQDNYIEVPLLFSTFLPRYFCLLKEYYKKQKIVLERFRAVGRNGCRKGNIELTGLDPMFGVLNSIKVGYVFTLPILLFFLHSLLKLIRFLIQTVHLIVRYLVRW